MYVCCIVEDSSLLCLKTKTPSCILKKKLKLCFAFEHLWLDFKLLNILFPLKLHPATLERQLNYLKCFVTMPLWQSNNLVIILCHQSFLLHCLSLTCWKLLTFLESILFFKIWFLKHRAFDYFSDYFCSFNGITVNLTEECDRGNMSKWIQSPLCTLLLQS